MTKKILVIPDTQAKPDDDLEFMSAIGNYIVEKRPDIIIHLGDLADMPSLSSYDVGKKEFEGRTYKADVDVAIEAQQRMFLPMLELQDRQYRNRKKVYDPKSVIFVGNHENRINRAISNDRKLEGLISTDDLRYSDFFDEVYPFLEVAVIEGIAFSHYFTSGVAGRPCSSAQQQLNKKHQSCISGHQQGFQMASGSHADGRRITSIIAGSCYEHDEGYLGAQGNKHWRGALVLHEVQNGEFDLMQVSLNYIKRNYL